MRVSLFFLLCLLLNVNFAITLNIEMTVNIDPGTEECFYEKFSNYQTIDVDYQVINGGQGKLDISFRLISPSGIRLAQDTKEPDNSHSVQATEDGVYIFCWDNTFSHFNSKTVFFEIIVSDSNEEDDLWKTDLSENTYDGWLPGEVYDMKIGDIQGSIERVHNSLHKIRQLQEMQRATEARDRVLAENNFFYVNVWAQAQIILMLAVGVVQVMLVRNLFETKPYPKK